MRLTAWLLLQALAAHLDDGGNLPALPNTSPVSKKEACTLTYSTAAAQNRSACAVSGACAAGYAGSQRIPAL